MNSSRVTKLTERTNQIEESNKWPSRQAILADFIKQLPMDLQNQIIAYLRKQVRLEQEGKPT